MAVTKTHPIKSTLKAAIDYILNPEKTDGKLLASSFGCGLETADIEFAWTREAAGDRGTHLGRHLIQSFAVGETTPEEAHKIGISEISRIIKRLYEDNVNGKISDERFMELSADYEAEQAELKKRAAALQAELDKSQAATVNAEKFMGIVRKHLAFEELTPTLLREMIEKIVVHECSYDENGTRRQDIEIYYSFVGKIDLPE